MKDLMQKKYASRNESGNRPRIQIKQNKKVQQKNLTFTCSVLALEVVKHSLLNKKLGIFKSYYLKLRVWKRKKTRESIQKLQMF